MQWPAIGAHSLAARASWAGLTRRTANGCGRSPPRVLAGAPEPPAARFNAGQKLNFALVCVMLLILYVSGVDPIVVGTHHNLIFGAHKLATIALGVLVAGHLYMDLVNRSTRPALHGMLTS